MVSCIRPVDDLSLLLPILLVVDVVLVSNIILGHVELVAVPLGRFLMHFLFLLVCGSMFGRATHVLLNDVMGVGRRVVPVTKVLVDILQVLNFRVHFIGMDQAMRVMHDLDHSWVGDVVFIANWAREVEYRPRTSVTKVPLRVRGGTRTRRSGLVMGVRVCRGVLMQSSMMVCQVLLVLCVRRSNIKTHLGVERAMRMPIVVVYGGMLSGRRMLVMLLRRWGVYWGCYDTK